MKAKTRGHNLNFRICLADFKGDYAGRQAVDTVFGIVEKVKGAVIAKGGKVRAFTYDNTPDRELNIDGCIPVLRFDIVTPYACVADLVCTTIAYAAPYGGTETVGMIDFK